MKRITREINEHWKPAWVNCGVCSENYSLVLHMDSLTRDSVYLSNLVFSYLHTAVTVICLV